jgi:hypothetical protein
VRLKIALLVSLLAAAVPLYSAIVIVRSDEAMIRTAPAIVTGTVLEIYPRHDDRGDIETVSRILVDETIKGDVPVGEIVDVVQFGGSLDGRFQAQSGAPRYEVGARYLVVLDRNGRGLWTTFDLALGQFRFLTRDGKQILARDTSEIVGWSASGEPFYDSDRSAPEFLAFAREVVRMARPHSVMELHPAPLTLDYDLKSVSQSAVSTWTGGASAMADTVSATPAGGDTKNLTDCESRVIADDPHGDVSGSCCPGVIATAFFGCGCAPQPCSASMKNGETYIALDMQDVVVNDGVSSATLSSGNFLSAMVHEIGHTWGFRHSNQNASNGSCSLPLPCDTNAIMNSLLVSGLNGTLQNWDKDAANEVYGDGSRQASFTGTQYVTMLGGQPARRPSNTSWRISQAACTAPSISTQPQSQTINSGQQANLSVVAAGTAPFTYLWYTGTPPGGPVAPGPNNTSATYNPSPTTTTTYWVRVFNSCGQIDSAVATVTVNQTGCTPPSISTQPTGSTITAGQFANLSVVAAGTGPLTYQWYVGNPPNTATPFGTGQSINVSPTTTTSYWVRVTGQCSPPADSNAAVVTVSAGCSPPTIINQPQDQQITSGTSTSLFVGYSGSASTVTWYRGVQNDTTNPVGSGQSFITGPLTTTTQYWAQLVNSCGTAQSRTVLVSVATACVVPNITLVDAAPKNVLPGGLVTLTAQATGTSLQFQWYRGVAPDLSNPVAGANTATATDIPQASTSYFVRVSNSCGSQNSSSIAIAVGAVTCNAPLVTKITDDTTISSNAAVTLEVTATGDATLHYQWYRGPSGDTSNPLGADSATFTTPALFSDAQFWVKVSNACTPAANSRSVNITVIPARHRAARH